MWEWLKNHSCLIIYVASAICVVAIGGALTATSSVVYYVALSVISVSSNLAFSMFINDVKDRSFNKNSQVIPFNKHANRLLLGIDEDLTLAEQFFSSQRVVANHNKLNPLLTLVALQRVLRSKPDASPHVTSSIFVQNSGQLRQPAFNDENNESKRFSLD